MQRTPGPLQLDSKPTQTRSHPALRQAQDRDGVSTPLRSARRERIHRLSEPLLGLAVALLLCSACGASSGNSQSSLQPTLSSIQANVFTPTCSVSGCHTSANPAGNLNLTASASYGALVNVPSYEVAPMKAPDGGYATLSGGRVLENICQDTTTVDAPIPTLVIPGNPTDSFLIWKLTGTMADGGSIEESTYCAQMPKISGVTLSTSQIGAIQTWIQNGAMNN